jgi:hypothetical protein
VRTLLEHDLVDELRLKIYVGTRTIDGDVVYLTHEVD